LISVNYVACGSEETKTTFTNVANNDHDFH